MKVITLRQKNILSFVLVLALLSLFIFSLYYSSGHNEDLQRQVDDLKSQTSQITAQTSDLQSKTMEFKKYRELWPSISEGKKTTSGIKMDDVNAKLNSLAEKYTIASPAIKVSLPETLTGGVFDRSTLNVLFTKINLTFDAVDDSRAILFLSEFLSVLPGYPVMTSFQISKGRSYTTQDLIAISTGKEAGAIKSSAEISWYALKNKDNKDQVGEAVDAGK